MHDYKTILLAWISVSSSVAAAIDERTVITIISAIVLPVIFFTAGKTIDVLLQIYLSKRKRDH